MLEKIVITSLIVMFLYASMEKKMIFSFVRDWLASLNDKYKKVIYDCYICMTSLWGSAVYWIIWHNDIKDWLITICASAGLNTVIFLLSTRDFE